jgi:hypothetical protein
MVPYFPQSAPSERVHGLGNAAGNCSMNALLQMLFAAPPLLEALMHVPELRELRRAYLQHTGVLKGSINSQALRAELHALNPRIDLHAGRWEDAHEVFSVMSSLVPQAVARTSFPAMRELREFEPEALYSADFHGDARQRSVLIEDAEHEHPYTLTDLPPQPFLFVDPIARERAPEANFNEQFHAAFDADESGNDIEDLPGYLHVGDNTHLHYHKQIRSTRTYETTPDYLVVVARRYRYSAAAQMMIRNDTPMQMPRVLQLPEGSTRDGSDGRLLLRSFVVYKPGHYVAYVRKETARGSQWYYCSDTTTRPVTLREVDKALYQTIRGGSYLHYYEKADDRVLDAEPAMNVNQPEKEDTRVATQETRLVWQLKALLESKQRRTKESLLQASFDLFKGLDKKTKHRAYELLYNDDIKQAGVDTFLANPKALLPILDQIGESTKALKAVLEQDVVVGQEDAFLQAAFAQFMKLKPQERTRCYEILCDRMIRERGVDAFLENPRALLRVVKANGRSLPIIDHLIDFTKKEPSSIPRSSLPPPLRTSMLPSTQIELAQRLHETKDRAIAIECFKNLKPKYQWMAYEAVARANKATGDDLATKGWKLLDANFNLLTSEIRAELWEAVKADLPVMPNSDQINDILERAFRGAATGDDLEAFDKLISPDHVNDLFTDPRKVKAGTLLNYIAKHDIKDIEHIRPFIEILAKKGADFNAREVIFFNNTPLIWAIANANYDVANLLIEVGSRYGARFHLQAGGNNALHLLLAKGYQTVSASQQKFRAASGTTLLRYLLTLDPHSINDTNGHGYTPLHIAALRRDIEFCRTLLEFGADPFAKGPNGETPLDMLEKTHGEANEIIKSFTSAYELPDDCFKAEISEQIKAGIRGLFPPATQLEVAFLLQGALDANSDQIDPLFQMLDPKYRRGIKSLSDLKAKIGTIIQTISDDQERASRLRTRSSKPTAPVQMRSSQHALDLDPSLSAAIGRPTGKKTAADTSVQRL